MAKKIFCILLITVSIFLSSCAHKKDADNFIVCCVQIVINDKIHATGFFINENGFILTSAHSLRSKYENNDILIKANYKGDSYDLSLFSIDEKKDIALLKSNIKVSEYVNLDTYKAAKCKYAYIYGNSQGNEIVKCGVEVIYREIDICTDMKEFSGAVFRGDIAQGFSGAPIIGSNLDFLGMVIGKDTRDNTVYALSHREIKNFLERNVCDGFCFI